MSVSVHPGLAVSTVLSHYAVEFLNSWGQVSLVRCVVLYGLWEVRPESWQSKHLYQEHLRMTSSSSYKRQPSWVSSVIGMLSDYMEW